MLGRLGAPPDLSLLSCPQAGPHAVTLILQKRLSHGAAGDGSGDMDRRTFSAGVLGCLSLLGIRPVWGGAVSQAEIPAGVTPGLADLADAWFGTGLAYERAHRHYCYGEKEPGCSRIVRSPDSPESLALIAAQKALAHAAAPVLRTRARTAGDVIVKYHVIDMHYGHWPPDDWAWVAAGGDALCEQVRREAGKFGVDLNPFWLKTASSFAEIDGDRHSPRWRAVARWRTARYESMV